MKDASTSAPKLELVSETELEKGEDAPMTIAANPEVSVLTLYFSELRHYGEEASQANANNHPVYVTITHLGWSGDLRRQLQRGIRQKRR